MSPSVAGRASTGIAANSTNRSPLWGSRALAAAERDGDGDDSGAVTDRP